MQALWNLLHGRNVSSVTDFSPGRCYFFLHCCLIWALLDESGGESALTYLLMAALMRSMSRRIEGHQEKTTCGLKIRINLY